MVEGCGFTSELFFRLLHGAIVRALDLFVELIRGSRLLLRALQGVRLGGLCILSELLIVWELPRAVRVQRLFGSSLDVGHWKACYRLGGLGGVAGLDCTAGITEL